MHFRFSNIRCALFSGVAYFIPLVATAATSGAFSIDLGMSSPIAINQMLTGTMDAGRSGAGSGNAPTWISFTTNLRFTLPAGVSLGGVINGSVTSTNIIKDSTHTGNFTIDMSLLNDDWGFDDLLIWPEAIGPYESFQFTDRITLTGSITVTNSNTTPTVVSGRTFNFWGHRYNRWDVPISGTVPAKSTCTITLSQPVISLGEIGFAQISSAASGARLNGMNGTVNVVTQCTGTQSAKLKLQTTAPVTASHCAKGNNLSMNFCAESGRNKININGEPININDSSISTGHSTEITFYATKGDKPALGKSSAALTIIASPD
ncbi:hypothetical protein [Pantoea piersonii]|uniref:hypothetical protein n=1 Tax=Pantoea piersonii TaxID=2364647 RepID=UPI00289D4454|nr:hypothetical protein [Pantoea piersonii]